MVSTDGAEGAASSGANPDAAAAAEAAAKKEEEEEMSSGEAEALKQQVIEGFTEKALVGCLTLLDTLPETVYRVTDLLIAIFARNGKEFKERLLAELMEEVKKSVDELLKPGKLADRDSEESARAAARVHLFTLLFEDCSRLCVRLVEA